MNNLGIRCDYLLTMAGGLGKVERDFFIGIDHEKISVIEPWGKRPRDCAKFIDARGKVVMPGLINGHTHLAMSLFKGLADDLPFEQWLHGYILPLEAKLVDANFVRIGTQLAALECIQNGVTTVCDMYFFADQVANALDESGLRGLVSEAICDFPTPDSTEKGTGYLSYLAKYKNHGRIQVCPGPHAPYSCNDDTLRKVKAFSENHELPIVMHVSETKGEVEESFKKYSKSPIKRLSDLGILGPKTILAHCVHLSDHDIELLSQSNTGVVYNPESNMKLGSGTAPVVKMLKAGIKMGIGTDGSASNNDLSLFREMDSGAKLQKLANHDNTAMTALDSLKLATWGGAQVLGLDAKIGSLEVGKLADIICVDFNHPHMQPVHSVLSQLVYSANGSEVDTVICHGQVLMENRQVKTLDSEKIFSSAQRIFK